MPLGVDRAQLMVQLLRVPDHPDAAARLTEKKAEAMRLTERSQPWTDVILLARRHISRPITASQMVSGTTNPPYSRGNGTRFAPRNIVVPVTSAPPPATAATHPSQRGLGQAILPFGPYIRIV